ncbi:hypothetical protein [Raoultella ornithinolytica]
MTDITELTPEAARESGIILIIVAARMARREFFAPLHTLCESGKRVVSTRALRCAVERAEEHMVSQVPKIVDGHDRLTKKLKEAESRNAELVEALEKAQRANAAQDDHINQMAKRIRRLEIKNTGIGQHINSLNRQIAGKTEIEQQQAVRIAELESRTVTVRLPPKIERDDADGWFMYKGGRVGGGAAEWYNKALDDVSSALVSVVTVTPEDANEVREEGNQFLVVRHPGKVPVIKHPVGQLEDYLLQILKVDPLATIDIVTHRYYGVGGQFVEDADEYLHEMGIKWEAE